MILRSTNFRRLVSILGLCVILGGNALAATFEQGAKYFNEKKYHDALSILLPLAERGHANAQVLVGLLYEEGSGVGRSYGDALKWYEAASKQESPRGTYLLARMYQQGSGIPENQTLATDLFQKAAAAGDLDAQKSLGDAYREGRGVPKNIYQAIKWYKHASQAGNVAALVDLGEIYEFGIGVTPDKAAALAWYRSAAAKGNESARAAVARIGEGKAPENAKVATTNAGGSQSDAGLSVELVKPSLPASSEKMPLPTEKSSSRRVALVIGNSNYTSVPALPNPQRDAELVAKILERIGFDTVTLKINVRRDSLNDALRDFARQAESADWALIYYAGHGMEVGGVNYIIPIDARIAADRDISFEAVSLEQLRNVASRARKLRLIVLDACRDNPFANQMKRTMSVATRSVSRGLASVEPEAGTLIVYAAKDGETAIDGTGANSPFTIAFVKNVQTPGLEVRRLFDYVRDDVLDATDQRQQPYSYGSLSGRQDFYFVQR